MAMYRELPTHLIQSVGYVATNSIHTAHYCIAYHLMQNVAKLVLATE